MSKGGMQASDGAPNDNPAVCSPPNHALRERDVRKVPYLPFRRISLTSIPVSQPPPSAASQRLSVSSGNSIDSLPEDEEVHTRSSELLSFPLSSALSRLGDRPDMRRRPSSTGSMSSIELNPRVRMSNGLRQNGPHRDKSRIKIAPHKSDDVLEAKKEKIMTEIWETENAYVNGLDIVYSHFLEPLISSLSDPSPLLTRNELTTIFSNFIDIWNLHRSLCSHLRNLFVPHVPNSPHNATIPEPTTYHDQPQTTNPAGPTTTPDSTSIKIPSLYDFSQILLSHFPYLSMYNPYVTAFPSALSLLTALSTPPPSYLQSSFPRPAQSGSGLKGYDPAFALWLKDREADPLCRRLKLRDWMLTIIQRCPRYLLLLKDLIACSSTSGLEHPALLEVQALLTRITNTLNASLHSHSLILSLISLQRATPNLPFPLIAPGRTLLRRSTLIKVDRGSDRRVRDVLLFSDCLMWISRGGEREDWGVWSEWANTSVGLGLAGSADGRLTPTVSMLPEPINRRDGKNRHLGLGHNTRSAGVPRTGRTRSRSDADAILSSPIKPTTSMKMLPSPPMSMLRGAVGRDEGAEDRWWYRGKAELLDVDVVMSPIVAAPDEERMFEVMSPEGSFALYAASQEERDEWVAAIRAAKTARLASLQVTHPNSTLTSSTSNTHLRRALQAVAHDPSIASSVSAVLSTPIGKGTGQKRPIAERRRKVDHFVPAIWVPDQKAEACMRCQSRFNWSRRRHHCRLCGRVVCASCSERTFYITDSSEGIQTPTPARACNACYETVFPLLHVPLGHNTTPGNHSPVDVPHSITSSLSMPSLALAIPPITTPHLPSVSSFGGLFSKSSLLNRSSHTLSNPPSLTQSRSTTSSVSESGLTSGSVAIEDENTAWQTPNSTERKDGILPDPEVQLAEGVSYAETVSKDRDNKLPRRGDESGRVGAPRCVRVHHHSKESLQYKDQESASEMKYDDLDPDHHHRSREYTGLRSMVRSRRPSPPVAGSCMGTPAVDGVGTRARFPPHISTTEEDESAHESARVRCDTALPAVDVILPNRVSIAPFPTQMPSSRVQDIPVTAQTRPQGTGKARRYSLLLGGSLHRGGLGANGISAVQPLAPAEAVIDDYPGQQRLSFRNGAAIGKLADLLGRGG